MLAAPGSDAWYNVGGAVVHQADGGGASAQVGNEVDITIRLPLGRVALEAGYGRFFGGAYVRDVDFAQRTADFLYVQTRVEQLEPPC